MRHIGATITTLVLALSMASTRFAMAAAAQGSSPVLIELFTAEGCSSCPPADAFLKQLDASQPIAGARLIVLGEHVDYWDHQGWPDPFSSASLTERQRGYVRALRLREPYTPQFIVDGATEMRLSERQKIAQLLKEEAAAAKIPVAIQALKVESAPSPFVSGRITADGSAELHKSEVYLGLALDHFESKVLRGENRGQLLTHVAVLFDLVKLGPLPAGGTFSQDFRVPLKAGIDPGNVRVVGFVQESDQGKIVGAALERTARAL
jgi:hypothetical protein